MAFFRTKGKSGQLKSKQRPGNTKVARPNKEKYKEKGNSASYVLKKIEQCISVCDAASSVKIVTEKLTEASRYIAELVTLENNGFYKGTPHAKDYMKSFVQRKDVILMDAIKRALVAGESKAKILEYNKFFTDEIKEFINQY